MLVLSKTDPFYLRCYYTFSLSIKKKRINNLRVKSDTAFERNPLPLYRRKQTGTLVPARVFTLLHEQQSNPSTPRDRYPKRSTSISFSLERYVTIVLHFVPLFADQFPSLPRLLRTQESLSID